MIIVVDAYNLLHQVFPHAARLPEAKLRQFIQQLGRYQKLRGQEIVLVFDSGPLLHATREVRSGIAVVFSGQKQSADEWIVDFVERHRGKELLLVSRDRKLIEACAPFGCDAVDVVDFYRIVMQAIFEDKESAQWLLRHERVEKYEHEEGEPGEGQEALDALMAGADVARGGKKNEEEVHRGAKEPTPSKEERRITKKIKKL